MAEEILVMKTVRCPACEQEAPLWMANPRLYTVASRESDRHVTAYRWVQGLVTGVLPHHYKVWQCPRCLFADLAENVDRGEPPRHADTVLQGFQDLSVEKQMILRSLRKRVPGGELDAEAALAGEGIPDGVLMLLSARMKEPSKEARGWFKGMFAAREAGQ